MFEDNSGVIKAVRASFGARRILVVGDLILDRYLWGSVGRISPEAPVPIVNLTRESYVGGGAANVAINLSGLGLTASVIGFTGSDHLHQILLDSLLGSGVDTTGVVALEDRPTISKTRVIGDHQHMLRIDHEIVEPMAEGSYEALLSAFHKQLQSDPAAIVLSDYAKGALTAQVTREIISAASQHGIPVLVDPKGSDYSKYSGATILSPNRMELAEVCRSDAQNLPALLNAGEQLRRDLGLEFLVVTLGSEGIAIMDDVTQRRIPTLAHEVADVSGAGDAVIATLAASLVAGLSRLDAAQLANLAGGIVVAKVGTAPVYRNELLAELERDHALDKLSKICDLEALVERTAKWRRDNLKIVFTNGCFDLLHAGHVSYLEAASKMGDRLVLGLNTDRSVRQLKGPSRPIMQEGDRAKVMSALASVDAVTFFDEETPLNLINAVKPDVLVKGADYTEDQVIGAKEVKSWGGEVRLVPLVEGQSTSRLIEELSNNNARKTDK
ncbi:MAG: D-glycero-beta-D-manno-heptose-7-phosphate kinase [Candidatus Marinimicrobia bacterium]|nr:D-glycero-beta-D-manno-heptose-7-phosphate kinase [Candidatus Neomarinimicrobiota bacterium]